MWITMPRNHRMFKVIYDVWPNTSKDVGNMPMLCSGHQHSSGMTAINQPEFLNTLPKTEPYNMEIIQPYCLNQKSGI